MVDDDGDGDDHLPLWDYVLEPKYSLGASPHVQELHACQQDFYKICTSFFEEKNTNTDNTENIVVYCLIMF